MENFYFGRILYSYRIIKGNTENYVITVFDYHSHFNLIRR